MSPPDQPLILVVDDDPFGLSYFDLSLKRAEFAVRPVRSVREATSCLEEEGTRAFAAVLADFRMPGQSGLDLLEWVGQRDPTLTTVIVTADGQKAILRDSLRRGAFDYLEKPVTTDTLRDSITRAVAHTEEKRRLADAEAGVRAAGRMRRLFCDIQAPSLDKRLDVFHQPRHSVGGDFLNVHEVAPGKALIIAGDVSGHDVKAAFTSAYFQGLARGFHGPKPDLPALLNLFNGLLATEWNQPNNGKLNIPTSLAACLVLADLPNRTLTTLNCGLPATCVVAPDGAVEHGPTNQPLGWFDKTSFEATGTPANVSAFYLYSDGLSDAADRLGVDPFALAFRCLRDGDSCLREHDLVPPDDILLMRLNMDAQPTPAYQPLVHESYAGNESDRIDDLQQGWRRSLRFALDKKAQERLYDVLLCCREAVLNAMQHGCEGSADKMCSLDVAYDPNLRRLRVRVDDPGHGHRFDIEERAAQLPSLAGGQLGLTLIRNLADRFALAHEGTSVVAEFDLPGND